MKIKEWKLWLFASLCFIFVGIINMITKKFLIGSAFSILGVAYIFLSITYYKKDNKSNKK